jgi:hypothetical protein
MPFSTSDQNSNGKWCPHVNNGGGWWYNYCGPLFITATPDSAYPKVWNINAWYKVSEVHMMMKPR